MLSDRKDKSLQGSPPIDQLTSHPVCFSFTNSLTQCIEIKKKNFFFTNQVPAKKIREYRSTIDKAFCDWSTKSIQKLKSEGVCYPVNNEIRNNIAKVFQMAGHREEWIKQNILDPDIYKFRVNKQIRIFGIVERNIVYLLLYDIWHLIDPVKEKNFPISDNRNCTWCLKSCDGK